MSASTSSSTTFKSTMASLAERAKAHHQSVQGAYEAYYGAGVYSQRSSLESTRSTSPAATPAVAAHASSKPSVWSRVKQHAREHHESVNSAYAVYYGVHRS